MKTNSNYIGLMNNGIHDSNGFSAIYPCPNGALVFFLFLSQICSPFLTDSVLFCRLFFFFSLTRYPFLSIAINSIDVENRAWFNFQNGIWWYIWFGTSISYECSRYTEAIMDLLFVRCDTIVSSNRELSQMWEKPTIFSLKIRWLPIYTHRNMPWLCANERYYDSNRNTYTNSIAHTTQYRSQHTQPTIFKL